MNVYHYPLTAINVEPERTYEVNSIEEMFRNKEQWDEFRKQTTNNRSGLSEDGKYFSWLLHTHFPDFQVRSRIMYEFQLFKSAFLNYVYWGHITNNGIPEGEQRNEQYWWLRLNN